MKLTPLDIHHKEFHHALRGYSEEEVDTFLDEVADEFERLFKENIDISEKLEAASAKVRDYQSMEVTLNNTMVSAQRSAEQIVAGANEDASTVLRDAEAKAKELIHAALTEKQKVQGELVRIKQVEEDFRARFRALLEQHLGEIREVDLPQDVTVMMGEPEAGVVSRGYADIAAPIAEPAGPVAWTEEPLDQQEAFVAEDVVAADETVADVETPVADAAEVESVAYMDEPVGVAEPMGAVEYAEAAVPETGEAAGFVESVALGELEAPDFEGGDLEEPREFSMPSFDEFGERDDEADIEEID